MTHADRPKQIEEDAEDVQSSIEAFVAEEGNDVRNDLAGKSLRSLARLVALAKKGASHEA